MYWRSIFFLFFFSQYLYANNISYSIEPVYKDNQNAFHVEMSIQTEGKTLSLKPPKFYISPNRPIGEGDDIQLVAKDAISVQQDARGIHITRKDHSIPFQIAYDFLLDPRVHSPHYPYLDKAYFQFPANYLLMTPSGLDTVWNISVKLLVPNPWNTVPERETRSSESIRSFLKKAYSGGDTYRQCDAQLSELCVSIYLENKNSTSPETLANNLFKLIRYQHAFWREPIKRPYWSFIKISDSERLVGTHTGKVMMMFLPLPEAERMPLIYYAFSHELFHQWLGRQYLKVEDFSSKEDRQIAKAIIEGFTDYYGLRLARESGLINNKGYAAIIEKHLREYNRHPALEHPLSELLKRNDFESFLTPTVHLLLLKHLKRGLSTTDIDNFIFSTTSRAIQDKATLFSLLSEHLGDTFIRDFKRVIIKGENLFSHSSTLASLI